MSYKFQVESYKLTAKALNLQLATWNFQLIHSSLIIPHSSFQSRVISRRPLCGSAQTRAACARYRCGLDSGTGVAIVSVSCCCGQRGSLEMAARVDFKGEFEGGAASN